MKELIEMSNKKYPENKNKERVKVLENSIVIEDSDYNDNDCKIYMTQEEKDLRKEQKPVEAKTQKKVIVANNNSAILQRLKEMNLNASNAVKRRGGLSEKEKDNIKELIKDNVVKIFKSEEINFDAKKKQNL